MRPNGECIIIRPIAAAKSGDALQTVHTEQRTEPLRCWLLQKPAKAMPTAEGLAMVQTWELRLATTEPVASGWRVDAKLDGDADYLHFGVLAATRSMVQRGVLHLTMEAVT